MKHYKAAESWSPNGEDTSWLLARSAGEPDLAGSTCHTVNYHDIERSGVGRGVWRSPLFFLFLIYDSSKEQTNLSKSSSTSKTKDNPKLFLFHPPTLGPYVDRKAPISWVPFQKCLLNHISMCSMNPMCTCTHADQTHTLLHL